MVAESTTRRLTLKKLLYHPLTWVAVGAHVVLLVVPFSSSGPKAVDNPTTQPEEIESIPVDILNLADIATSEPPLEPASTNPSPPRSAPLSAIAPSTQDTPIPTKLDARSAADEVTQNLESQGVQTESSSSASSAQTQQLGENQTLAYDPSADQQQYIQNLDSLGLGGYKDPNSGERSLPGVSSFRRNTDSSYFITETGTRPYTVIKTVEAARDARWLDKEPSTVLAEQEDTYSTLGLSFVKVDNYGGEPLYQLTKEDGSPVMYLSLVQLQGSTLLVIWQVDPRA